MRRHCVSHIRPSTHKTWCSASKSGHTVTASTQDPPESRHFRPFCLLNCFTHKARYASAKARHASAKTRHTSAESPETYQQVRSSPGRGGTVCHIFVPEPAEAHVNAQKVDAHGHPRPKTHPSLAISGRSAPKQHLPARPHPSSRVRHDRQAATRGEMPGRAIYWVSKSHLSCK